MTQGALSSSTGVLVLVMASVCIAALSGGVTRASLTVAQNTSTAAFLKAFTVTMPGLANIWVGDDWCTWPYVRCSPEGGVAVIIDNAGLFGHLPELNVDDNSIHVALTEISITNMNITGGFKDSWCNLRHVRTLNFTNTNLFGTIPLNWSSMRSLQAVVLTNSSACGSLPSWTSRSLKIIDVGYNLLRGPLPETWGYISSLQNVSLLGNYFCGCNPPSWMSRVLTNAVFQAMGAAPYADDCKPPINCASEAEKCSRDPPTYSNAAADVAPTSRAAAILTALLLPLMATFL